jgi:hypothetical protein
MTPPGRIIRLAAARVAAPPTASITRSMLLSAGSELPPRHIGFDVLGVMQGIAPKQIGFANL